MKYNIWYVELYHGWSDYDGPEDCNFKKKVIMNDSFTKEQVEDMLTALWPDERVVQIHKCELVKSDKLYLEDI